MFSFLAILLNCTDWAIAGRKARVQFNSTLERKVKTRTLKGIFLVRKWINNPLKSNSVWCHMNHRKNLFLLSSFALPAVFVKVSLIAVFVSIVTSKRARWPPLFITFLSSSWLVTSVYQVLAKIYVRFFYYGITLKISTLFVVSHDLSAKVPPEWRSNPSFGSQKTCFFTLNRGVPSIEVTDTKIIRTFLRDQILWPLNRGVPKERFNYFLYFRLTCGCLNNDSAIEL